MPRGSKGKKTRRRHRNICSLHFFKTSQCTLKKEATKTEKKKIKKNQGEEKEKKQDKRKKKKRVEKRDSVWESLGELPVRYFPKKENETTTLRFQKEKQNGGPT